MVKMTVSGLRYGQKVTSLQGRDYGRDYIIVGFEGEYFLLLADGKIRPIGRPKKKNIKHVRISLKVDQEIEDKFKDRLQPTDEDLHRALLSLGDNLEEGEMYIG